MVSIAKPRRGQVVFVHRINNCCLSYAPKACHLASWPKRLRTVLPETNLPLFTLTSKSIQKIVQIINIDFKYYSEFIFSILTYFILRFILWLFTSSILGVVKIRGPWTRSMIGGPWTRSIIWWTQSMDLVHWGGPWTRGTCFVLSQKTDLRYADYPLTPAPRTTLRATPRTTLRTTPTDYPKKSTKLLLRSRKIQEAYLTYLLFLHDQNCTKNSRHFLFRNFST